MRSNVFNLAWVELTVAGDSGGYLKIVRNSILALVFDSI
jgi:hypothetical protein